MSNKSAVSTVSASDAAHVAAIANALLGYASAWPTVYVEAHAACPKVGTSQSGAPDGSIKRFHAALTSEDAPVIVSARAKSISTVTSWALAGIVATVDPTAVAIGAPEDTLSKCIGSAMGGAGVKYGELRAELLRVASVMRKANAEDRADIVSAYVTGRKQDTAEIRKAKKTPTEPTEPTEPEESTEPRTPEDVTASALKGIVPLLTTLAGNTAAPLKVTDAQALTRIVKAISDKAAKAARESGAA